MRKKKNIKEQVGVIEASMAKPRLYLDAEMLPEIKEWKVGDKYEIMLNVRQVGMREDEDGTFEASFEIIKASTEGEEDD